MKFMGYAIVIFRKDLAFSLYDNGPHWCYLGMTDLEYIYLVSVRCKPRSQGCLGIRNIFHARASRQRISGTDFCFGNMTTLFGILWCISRTIAPSHSQYTSQYIPSHTRALNILNNFSDSLGAGVVPDGRGPVQFPRKSSSRRSISAESLQRN
jgi:hypothetical protein